MSNVQPNDYHVSGEGVRVVYSTIGPSLDYTGPAESHSFSGAQITTQAIAIGTLVTVVITRTVDTGATLFSLLIPLIELADVTQTQAFSTIGIWTRTKGPDSFPSTGVRESYSTNILTGTASCTHPHVVPLYGVPIHQAIASGDLAQMKRLATQAAALTNPGADIVSAVAGLKEAIAKAGG